MMQYCVFQHMPGETDEKHVTLQCK